MYAGRMMGGQLPYGIGEVGPHGYGPYLGDFWDDAASIAEKVGLVADQAQRVVKGEAKVALVPTDHATISLPIPGSYAAVSVPILPIALGVGLLAWFAMRKRR